MPCRWVKVGGRTSTAPSPGRRHGTAAPVGTRVVLHLVHVLGALACLQVPALGFLLGFPSVFWCDKEYA